MYLYQAEIRSWKRFWETEDTTKLPEDLVDCITHADDDFFPNVRKLRPNRIIRLFPVTEQNSLR